MPKLTKRFIDYVKPSPDRDLFFWDDDLKCFGLRVKPSGQFAAPASCGGTTVLFIGASSSQLDNVRISNIKLISEHIEARQNGCQGEVPWQIRFRARGAKEWRAL